MTLCLTEGGTFCASFRPRVTEAYSGIVSLLCCEDWSIRCAGCAGGVEKTANHEPFELSKR